MEGLAAVAEAGIVDLDDGGSASATPRPLPVASDAAKTTAVSDIDKISALE